MAATITETPRFSPELRTGIYYTTMYMSVAVVSAYLGIWLNSKGLPESDIGLVNSVPVFVILALNIFVGRLADRASDWRKIIIIGSVIAGVVPLGLFFANSFWEILVLWTLCVVPFSVISPVADAAGIRMTRRNGTDFAVIRAWGTLGNMVVLVLTGLLAGVFGPSVFVPLFLATCLVRALASLLLPAFRVKVEPNPMVPSPTPAIAAPGPAISGMAYARKLWFVLPVVATSLSFGTLMVFHIFAALTWQKAGIPISISGPLLALGALSEAILMFKFAGIAKRFTARHLILIGALVAAVRWVVMAFDPPLWALVPLQLTHGLSFAFGYLGLLNFIANWTHEDVAAEAQSFAMVVQQAVAVVTMAAFGFLFQWLGAHAFLVSAGICVIAALFVWWSLLLAPAEHEAVEVDAVDG